MMTIPTTARKKRKSSTTCPQTSSRPNTTSIHYFSHDQRLFFPDHKRLKVRFNLSTYAHTKIRLGGTKPIHLLPQLPSSTFIDNGTAMFSRQTTHSSEESHEDPLSHLSGLSCRLFLLIY